MTLRHSATRMSTQSLSFKYAWFVHTNIPNNIMSIYKLRQKQVDLWEFKASLVCLLRSLKKEKKRKTKTQKSRQAGTSCLGRNAAAGSTEESPVNTFLKRACLTAAHYAVPSFSWGRQRMAPVKVQEIFESVGRWPALTGRLEGPSISGHWGQDHKESLESSCCQHEL